MGKVYIGILALAAAILIANCASTRQAAITYEFQNGLWFNGTSFEASNFSVSGGRLVPSKHTDHETQVIDLQNRYVVPPFCEGHNHNIGDTLKSAIDTSNRYLAHGVFYVSIAGSFHTYRNSALPQLNSPTSVDVAFANNGLTGSGGHPRRVREMLLENAGLYPEFTKTSLADAGYFEAATQAELREKWALILNEKPDYVKVMLLYSEEFDKRKDNPEYFGRRGLNPALLPGFIRLAHDENLPVGVHVETDHDMGIALSAGADIIMHTPSYNSAQRLSDKTVSLAANSKASVVTTFIRAKRYALKSPQTYQNILDAQRYNLTKLLNADVNLVVGSDSIRDTSRGETFHLEGLGVIDNATLLNMWTRNCVNAFFPDRKIGKLEYGYEASFLILNENPLEDFEATKDISMFVKDGAILNPQFKPY